MTHFQLCFKLDGQEFLRESVADYLLRKGFSGCSVYERMQERMLNSFSPRKRRTKFLKIIMRHHNTITKARSRGILDGMAPGRRLCILERWRSVFKLSLLSPARLRDKVKEVFMFSDFCFISVSGNKITNEMNGNMLQLVNLSSSLLVEIL